MEKNYDPDWPSKNEMKEPEHLSFWQFLIGFVLLEIVIWAAAAFCPGCTTTPEGNVTITVPAQAVDFVTNIAQRGASAWNDRESRDEAYEKASAGTSEGGSDTGGGASSGSDAPASSSSTAALDFRYGGFKGCGAKEDSRCRLGSPKITKDKISYKWETGIPSDWKRFTTSKGPMVVACAFYWDDGAGKWVGGKMDWTDEARTSRATDKIYGGYNGWQSAGWDAAKRRAFCVVSADGKYRSNLIED